MRKFKDSIDHKWSIELDLTKARKIRTQLGIDLLRPDHALQVRQSLLDRLTIVYLLCEKQAKKIEISIEEFDERIYGDGISYRASNALMEELADFFHRLGLTYEAMLTEKELEVMKASQKMNRELIETGELESLMNHCQEELLATLEETGGNGSQDSKLSQESVPEE